MEPKRARTAKMLDVNSGNSIEETVVRGSGTGKVVWKNQFRCNLASLVYDIKEMVLQQRHQDALQRTPFWPLLRSILNDQLPQEHCRKRNEDIRMILRFFEHAIGGFQFGDTIMHLGRDDVKLVFGVKDGSREIVIDAHKVKVNTFMDTVFDERKLMTPARRKEHRMVKTLLRTKIAERINSIEQVDVDDVARLVTCHVLGSVMLVKHNQSLSWAYTYYVSNLDIICEYDWSGHILDLLLGDLLDISSHPVERCVQILQYMICERTSLVTPEDNTGIPRCLKWDLRKLTQKLNTELLRNLGEYMVVNGAMVMTDREYNELVEVELGDMFGTGNNNSVEMFDIVPETNDLNRDDGESDVAATLITMNVIGSLHDAVGDVNICSPGGVINLSDKAEGLFVGSYNEFTGYQHNDEGQTQGFATTQMADPTIELQDRLLEVEAENERLVNRLGATEWWLGIMNERMNAARIELLRAESCVKETETLLRLMTNLVEELRNRNEASATQFIESS